MLTGSRSKNFNDLPSHQFNAFEPVGLNWHYVRSCVGNNLTSDMSLELFTGKLLQIVNTK